MGLAPTTPTPVYSNIAKISNYTQSWNATLNPPRPCNLDDPGGGTWVQAQDPLHSDPQAGVGFALAGADRLITRMNDPAFDPDLHLGIVPCAWGGTPMRGKRGWMRGYNHRELAYSWAVARTLRAAEWGEPLAVWMRQGHADAKESSDPWWWMEELLDFWHKFKLDVGFPGLKLVYDITGPVSPELASTYPGLTNLRNYQRYGEKIHPNIGVVSSEEVTLIDGLHSDQASQISVGHAFGDKTFTMLGGVLPVDPQYFVGDRQSDIMATSSAGLLTQSASNLIDGSYVDNSSGSTWMVGGVDVTGKALQFQWVNAPVCVKEIRWRQSNNAVLGTFKCRASNDGTSWTDIGNQFSLGGATTQIIQELAGNTSAWSIYELLGVSGTAPSGGANPYLREVEFKH